MNVRPNGLHDICDKSFPGDRIDIVPNRLCHGIQGSGDRFRRGSCTWGTWGICGNCNDVGVAVLAGSRIAIV